MTVDTFTELEVREFLYWLASVKVAPNYHLYLFVIILIEGFEFQSLDFRYFDNMSYTIRFTLDAHYCCTL